MATSPHLIDDPVPTCDDESSDRLTRLSPPPPPPCLASPLDQVYVSRSSPLYNAPVSALAPLTVSSSQLSSSPISSDPPMSASSPSSSSSSRPELSSAAGNRERSPSNFSTLSNLTFTSCNSDEPFQSPMSPDDGGDHSVSIVFGTPGTPPMDDHLLGAPTRGGSSGGGAVDTGKRSDSGLKSEIIAHHPPLDIPTALPWWGLLGQEEASGSSSSNSTRRQVDHDESHDSTVLHIPLVRPFSPASISSHSTTTCTTTRTRTPVPNVATAGLLSNITPSNALFERGSSPAPRFHSPVPSIVQSDPVEAAVQDGGNSSNLQHASVSMGPTLVLDPPPTPPLDGSNRRPHIRPADTSRPTSQLSFRLASRHRSNSSASIASRISNASSVASVKSRVDGLKSKWQARIQSNKHDHDQGEPSQSSGTTNGRTESRPRFLQARAYTAAAHPHTTTKSNVNRPQGLFRKLMTRSKSTPGDGQCVTETTVCGVLGDVRSPQESEAAATNVSSTSRGRDTRLDLDALARSPLALTGLEKRPSHTSKSETHSPQLKDDHETSIKGPVKTERVDNVLESTRDVRIDTPGSLFDARLPRELQLLVFQAVIDIHVAEHQELVQKDRWKGQLAQKRWYGESAGRRELIKLSGVCDFYSPFIVTTVSTQG